MRTRKNKPTRLEKAALLPDSEKTSLANYGAVTAALLYEIFKYLPFQKTAKPGGN